MLISCIIYSVYPKSGRHRPDNEEKAQRSWGFGECVSDMHDRHSPLLNTHGNTNNVYYIVNDFSCVDAQLRMKLQGPNREDNCGSTIYISYPISLAQHKPLEVLKG